MAEQKAPGDQALPWAVQQASMSHGKPSECTHSLVTNDLQPISIDQLGLQPGDRIEVKWHIESDEGDSCSRWWGASIAGVVAPAQAQAGGTAVGGSSTGDGGSTAGGSGLQQRHIYLLKYDAAEGFDEETAEVLLLGEHELFDKGSRGVMLWRREGDTNFDPADDDEDEELADAVDDADGDEAQGGTVSVGQLADMFAESAEDGPGGSSTGGGQQQRPRSVLAQLIQQGGVLEAVTASANPEQLQLMESGFKDFMENFKAYTTAKASCADGGDVVITAEDVREFSAMMQTQKAGKQQGRYYKP